MCFNLDGKAAQNGASFNLLWQQNKVFLKKKLKNARWYHDYEIRYKRYALAFCGLFHWFFFP